MRLTCQPASFWTWDYLVEGGSRGPATLSFNYTTEQGSITSGGERFEVRKHGPFSGYWTVERSAQVHADAKKPSAMFREFDVRCGETSLTVKARHAFSRCFDMHVGGRVVGSIEPMHLFTRRAIIDCQPSVPHLAQLLSFWMVGILWRRAARNHAHAGAGAHG